MALVKGYFEDFVSEIRLTDPQISELKSAHTKLREWLREDVDAQAIYVSDFLQGSYRRGTAVRPKGDKRADVDIIVVTNLDRNGWTPDEAIKRLEPFVERHYKGKWELQGRSIGISMSEVDLDLVLTSAPSEVVQEMVKSLSAQSDLTLEEAKSWRLSESWQPANRFVLAKAAEQAEWKTEPLWIPDRDANTWEQTDPLEQIKWTRDKNQNCGGLFVNVVKALNWWKKPEPKYPKGYPVEHLIGSCCPDGIGSLAEGVTLSLENVVSRFADEASRKETPYLKDHGVDQNVFGRVSGDDFAQFYDQVKSAATLARTALDEQDVAKSVKLWCELFGEKFPKAPESSGSGGKSNSGGGYTERSGPTTIRDGRFA